MTIWTCLNAFSPSYRLTIPRPLNRKSHFIIKKYVVLLARRPHGLPKKQLDWEKAWISARSKATVKSSWRGGRGKENNPLNCFQNKKGGKNIRGKQMKEQNIVTGSLRQSSLNAYTLLAFLPPRGGTASCSPWAQAGDPCGTESSCKQRRAARPSTCRTAGVLREGFREEEKHRWPS